MSVCPGCPGWQVRRLMISFQLSQLVMEQCSQKNGLPQRGQSFSSPRQSNTILPWKTTIRIHSGQIKDQRNIREAAWADQRSRINNLRLHYPAGDVQCNPSCVLLYLPTCCKLVIIIWIVVPSLSLQETMLISTAREWRTAISTAREWGLN